MFSVYLDLVFSLFFLSCMHNVYVALALLIILFSFHSFYGIFASICCFFLSLFFFSFSSRHRFRSCRITYYMYVLIG